jgi:hypothetical protein
MIVWWRNWIGLEGRRHGWLVGATKTGTRSLVRPVDMGHSHSQQSHSRTHTCQLSLDMSLGSKVQLRVAAEKDTSTVGPVNCTFKMPIQCSIVLSSY